LDLTITFGLGLIIALVGVIPPGLLNMTAAKVSIKDGHSRGLIFSLGVCIIVILQTFLALIFARYLTNHPYVVDILQRVAFVIFVLIAVYFLLLANKEAKPNVESNVKSKKSRFFYMAITLASFGWLTFDSISITSYVAGAATGTFVMLYVYVFFFERIKSKKIKSQKNMNFSIGLITGIISIITLINIIKELE